jgi:tyrosyl-tRNA synthetase
VAGGGIAINKEKLMDSERFFVASDLLNNQYLLVQKGKKNYYLLLVK